jgi:hypothetical protein
LPSSCLSCKYSPLQEHHASRLRKDNENRFLVIFPALFQLILSRIAIPILSAELSDATPSQVNLSLAASIKIPLGLTVRLDPVNLNLVEASMDTNQPYALLSFPTQKLHGNAGIGVVNQTTPLLNLTLWQGFLEQVLYQPKAFLSFRSKVEMHLAALHCNIHFNKDIAITGMFPYTSASRRFTNHTNGFLAGVNNFSGIAIQDPKLVLPPEADGTNLLANVLLPNPSVISLGAVSCIRRCILSPSLS